MMQPNHSRLNLRWTLIVMGTACIAAGAGFLVGYLLGS
jgi:hypothetical protein